MTTHLDPTANGSRAGTDEDELGVPPGYRAIAGHTNAKAQQIVVAKKWGSGHLSGKPGRRLLVAATLIIAGVAAVAFAVSLRAQYQYIFAIKHSTATAWSEALIADAAMVGFALMALALAWTGQTSRIERALIAGLIALSAVMNYAAAQTSSPKSVLAYVMPAVVLGILVDRIIAVIRRHVLGHDDHAGWNAAWKAARTAGLYTMRLIVAPLSTIAGFVRWLRKAAPVPENTKIVPREALDPLLPLPLSRYFVRAFVAMDPWTTLTGMRRLVIAAVPVPDKPAKYRLAAGRRPPEQLRPPTDRPAIEAGTGSSPKAQPAKSRPARKGRNPAGSAGQGGETDHRRSVTKTARFLDLVEQEPDEDGQPRPLWAFPLSEVSPVASRLAWRAGLDTGAARTALRAKVLAAKTHHLLQAVEDSYGPLADLPPDRLDAIAHEIGTQAGLPADRARQALRDAVLEARPGQPAQAASSAAETLAAGAPGTGDTSSPATAQPAVQPARAAGPAAETYRGLSQP